MNYEKIFNNISKMGWRKFSQILYIHFSLMLLKAQKGNMVLASLPLPTKCIAGPECRYGPDLVPIYLCYNILFLKISLLSFEISYLESPDNLDFMLKSQTKIE